MFRESGAYEPDSKMGKWLENRGVFGHFNYFQMGILALELLKHCTKNKQLLLKASKDTW